MSLTSTDYYEAFIKPNCPNNMSINDYRVQATGFINKSQTNQTIGYIFIPKI